MAGLDRDELEERCTRLLSQGQQVTARIEQLVQDSHRDGAHFDRELERLRREQHQIHGHLELAMKQLQALDQA